jgi:hypothetical protein
MRQLVRTVVLLSSALAVAGCPSASNRDRDRDRDRDPPPPSEHLTAARLEELTRALADDALEGRDEGTAGGDAARALLVERLTACGVLPAALDGFEQPIVGGRGTNVLGRVEGTTAPERIVLVSAHFDHLGRCGGQICNGAYDNAGGVAVAVGIACDAARAPLEKTVLVALWDAEEPPTFLTAAMGSAFFANSGLVDLERIDTAIVLDLVGGELWPGYQKHFVMGAEKTPTLSTVLDGVSAPAGLEVARGGMHLIEETPFGRQPWSDYDAFRNRGVPFLFFSDGQNKLYHTVDDEADTVHYEKLEKEAEHLRRVVAAIAAESAPFHFAAGGEELARDAATVIEILDDALAPGGLVDSLGLTSTSRGRLQGTREAILAEGATGTFSPSTLEAGALRVMCYAGSTYSEAECNFF